MIFEEILKKLISFILDSPCSWVRHACSMLTGGPINLELEFKSSNNMFEMVQFSLEVLHGSFFCLEILGEESRIIPGILAAIFIIDWEFNLGKIIDGMEKKIARLDIGQSVHALHCRMNNQFWTSLGTDGRKILETILVQCIRSAIFSEDKVNTEKFTSLCCNWMLEVLGSICQDHYEEQHILDQLLCKDEKWPFWTIPGFSSTEPSVPEKAPVATDVSW